MNEDWIKYEFVLDNFANEYIDYQKSVVIYFNMTANISPNTFIFDIISDDNKDKIENLEIDFRRDCKNDDCEEDNEPYIMETNPNFRLKQHYFTLNHLKKRMPNIVFPKFEFEPQIEIMTTDNVIFKKLYFDIYNEDKTYVIVNCMLTPPKTI